jgi:cytochrome c oxidase assembly factor CtaG
VTPDGRDPGDLGQPRSAVALRRLLGFLVGSAVTLAGVPVVLAHSDLEPVLTPSSLVLAWSFDPLLQVGLLATAALYLVAIRRIDRAHPDTPVPWPRVVAFLLGIVVIEVALQSSIGTYDDTLFSVHMVQHMLLMFVAAPLLVLGTPITVTLRAVSPRVRKGIVLPVLHSRVVRVIGHPLVAWMLFVAVLYGSHISPLFDITLTNDLVHELEHAMFLASALLFWWPVVGLDPSPYRLPYPMRAMYLFLAFPLMTFLSLYIFSAPSPLYPHYAAIARDWGPAPLDDQQAAGAIMWVWGDLTFLVSILLVVAAWLRDEERRTARTEGRADAERAAIREREARLAARLEAERGIDGTKG